MKKTNSSRWYARYVFEYFTADTLDGVKKEYKQLVKRYHPDVNPADQFDYFNHLMGCINEEYDYIINNFSDYTPAKKSGTSESSQDTQRRTQTNASANDDIEITPEMQAALNALNGLDGLNINIVGKWIWIDGNTRTHKDALKAAGYKWAPKKSMWYWAPADHKHRYTGKTTFEDNCNKYGCRTYTAREKEKIAG